MNILAIGAGGFLGSFIVAELVELGHTVTIMDFKSPAPVNPVFPVLCFQGDVTSMEDVQRAMDKSQPEAVLSLAGLLTELCSKEPFKAVQVNIGGVSNVLEQARLHDVCRVVNASSAGVCSPDRVDTQENCRVSPEVSMYGATKFLGEVLGREYRHNYGLEVVNLRYSLIYGPGEVATPGNAMRLKAIESAVTGKDVTIDGLETDCAHLLHVKDAAHATVLALTVPGPLKNVYNIAGVPGDFLTFAGIVDILRRINPKTGNVAFKGTGTPVKNGLYLCDTARQELGYAPSYTAEKGLRENAEILLR